MKTDEQFKSFKGRERQIIRDVLRENGIPENSGEASDYERAKGVILGDMAVGAGEYERIIKIIYAYVGV